MSSMMLSASLASVEAYDAVSLSQTTVVARVLASRRTCGEGLAGMSCPKRASGRQVLAS